MKTLNITVMLGGPSAEREVSLRTGAAVAKALRSLGHNVHELQGQLEKLGVPYTGCDAEASRIAFDKVLTKQRCVEAGVPTAKFVVVDSAKVPWPRGWTPPVVVKPVRQGSSVGLQFVHRVEEWSGAIRESLRHDTQVLAEEKIEGRETTVGILDGAALPVVEVRAKQGVLDYRNKYTPGATEYFCPARFDHAITERIQSAALGAFRAIGGRDYARVDVMVRASGEPVMLEVNTLPGMTETSLLPKAAAAAGLNYEALCQRMIELALNRRSDFVKAA
jgi:D-alanine-D-alanine ligase